MKPRIAFGAGIALALAACSDSATAPTSIKTPVEPALARQEAPVQMLAKDGIAGEYIVVLNDAEDPGAVSAAHAVRPAFTYSHSIKGFAAKLSRGEVEQLRRDSRVKYISQNGIARISQDRPGGPALDASAISGPSVAVTQPTPAGLWGLDRIDQATTINGSYVYTNKGTGVKVYILDTGGNFTHNDFDGAASNRYKKGFDFVTFGGTAADCHGHGTHVAGTIGGTQYGVAKAVTMYAVRVLDCAGNGSWANVIAGIDWITYNHIKPAVANASLGGGFIQAVNDAMTKSVLYGVTWVVASGNNAADACSFSPSSTPLAISVNASDINDNRASFSDYGVCTDLYAPGVNVQSAWIGSTTATATISGTSMASPHVAGNAALFLQTKPTATPVEVANVLLLNAQENQIVGNIGATANLLVYKNTGSCAAPATYCTGLDGNTQFPNRLGGTQWYYISGTGIQRGYLRGSTGTDFDLELNEWNGTAWILRVNSVATTTNPTITFNSTCAFGTANCFKQFRVKSKTGVGAFDFWFDRQ